MSNAVAKCPQCTGSQRLRVRDFSSQAWSALVSWQEIDKKAVGQALCDSCYGELRDILIDREADLGKEQPDTAASRRKTARTVKKAG